MVTQIRPGSAKYPLAGAVDHTEYRRKLGRRIDAEMRVDDAAECGRHREAGHQLGRDVRRDCKDDGVVGAEIDTVPGELELRCAAVGKLQRNELIFEGNGNAVLAQPGNRRLDKDRPQAIARQKRAARLAAKRDGFPDQDAGKLGRAFGRRNVERGE